MEKLNERKAKNVEDIKIKKKKKRIEEKLNFRFSKRIKERKN